ncbi:MAG TPA: tripartite tricarboxylate transporter substrate binding protein [Candidatus Acidoferrum sp.]|jgi:tripartite-type tricarboxylate transporter receptor subunit TctC|nr:tripartite tricarboxylate transporter substrate binding protein [Candidatus Acidoferrum sp.]
MLRIALSVLTVLVLLIAGLGPAAAQYPERPITILTGYPAGGMVDIVARALSEGLKKKYPKGVGIVTRPGAGGSLAVAELVQAKPDGYTIILAPLSTLVIHPQLNDLPYKTPDDYEAIINTVAFYSLLTVRADAPWKTVQEFIAASKASPGKLRVGSPGEGTSSHLNLEELKRQAGMNVTHVPFSGWGESSPALLGGHVEALSAQPGEVRPLVDGGKLRVLLVFQPKRNPVFPDVPSAKELGWEAAGGTFFMMVAPKGTPGAVLKYIHDATKAAMDEPQFVNVIKQRAIDLDYRAGDQLKADLWKEYKYHTEILTRLGMIKKK